jgi:hypothetical protein
MIDRARLERSFEATTTEHQSSLDCRITVLDALLLRRIVRCIDSRIPRLRRVILRKRGNASHRNRGKKAQPEA